MWQSDRYLWLAQGQFCRPPALAQSAPLQLHLNKARFCAVAGAGIPSTCYANGLTSWGLIWAHCIEGSKNPHLSPDLADQMNYSSASFAGNSV